LLLLLLFVTSHTIGIASMGIGKG